MGGGGSELRRSSSVVLQFATRSQRELLSSQTKRRHWTLTSRARPPLAGQVRLFMLTVRWRLISVLPITAESLSIRARAPPDLLPVHAANTGSKEKQLHHGAASLSAHKS